MERNVHILTHDARAPLCIEVLPRWRYERAFGKVLSEFLREESDLFREGVNFLTSHHLYSQQFVDSVDKVLVSEKSTLSEIRSCFVKLLDSCRALLRLERYSNVVECLRENLVEDFSSEGGVLPEFARDKGASELFLQKLAQAGVSLRGREEKFSSHLSDVYDDCARTLQLGFWIIASAWKAQVVDAWLFETAYPFFNHTLPSHLSGPESLTSLLSEALGELIRFEAPPLE